MERTIQVVQPMKLAERKLLRVAAYARVSCDKDAMRHSLQAQVDYYKKMITSNPDWSFAGIYPDAYYTGTRDDRPHFVRLIKDCKDGKIDRIITKTISRFARNTLTLLTSVRDLKRMGIGIYFEEQNIDTLTEAGEMMITLFASQAQEESRATSENCKDDNDDDPKPPEEKRIIESTTDPDSGVFHKGEHKKCFAYEAHTMCEKHGYVLEVEVTPGNVHDSVAFDTVFKRATEHYPEIEVVTADAGYKTPWICKQIIDSGRLPSLPYKRPMTKKGNLPWYEYVYDEYYDCVLCPQYKVLSYATTNREGYREYKSKGYVCQNCPVREQCTQNHQCVKTVTRHIWHDYIERAEDVRHSPIGKETYALRSQTIERVFADAKEKHAMRYTPYRGLPAVTVWVKLKFAALNLKKFAIHKWMRFLFSFISSIIEATLPSSKVASLTI